MTTVRYTAECYPDHLADQLGLHGPVAQADHANCQGRFTTQGVLGGWVCPCPCHRETRK